MQHMTEWYYAKNGQQNGPVSFEKLRDLAANGMLDPAKDLVWNGTMKDWTPAGQVEGIFVSKPIPLAVPPSDPSNPYSAPQSDWSSPVVATGADIVPGTDRIDPVACIQRGFELTKQHFGMLLVVGLIYFGISMGLAFAQNILDAVVLRSLPASYGQTDFSQFQAVTAGQWAYLAISRIFSQAVGVYLSLGTLRISLNIVDGLPFSPGMVFSHVNRLVRATVVYFILMVASAFGFLLLIFPGIYIWTRWGQALIAVVDRDMSVGQAFAYSSSITTNNRVNVFLLYLLCILVGIAGALACCIGLFFAMPMIWLATAVAYRWMQKGRIAATQSGTVSPGAAIS
jgi:uncharacterized membrane protein